VHAEDSSSANVNYVLLRMKICGMKQTLPGVVEITPDTGSAFFLRISYLSLVKEEQLVPAVSEQTLFSTVPFTPADKTDDTAAAREPGMLTDEEAADLLHAALVYSAECAAMTYLARAEQSRFGLTQKLLHKGVDKHALSQALDYLEQIHYLDDGRFASAWLRSRSIDHAEGKIRLAAELASRGIQKETAANALKEFFTEHEELELCRKAYQKLGRRFHDEEKIRASLMRSGFTVTEIRTVLAER